MQSALDTNKYRDLKSRISRKGVPPCNHGDEAAMRADSKNGRLYEKLKEDILSGICPPGFRFPPEIVHAQNLGVSRNTLRLALKQLESEDLILREGGRGTFVNPAYNPRKSRRYLLILSSAPAPEHTEHIVPQISRGIEQALRDREIDLEQCSHEHLMTLSKQELVEMLSRRRISGVLWKATNFHGNEKILQALKLLPIPVVLLYCNPADYRITNCAAIPQNTRNAWCEALRYLRRCGHTRIGIIDPLRDGLIRAEFTQEEYAALLRPLRLDPDPALLVSTNATESSVAASVEKLMALPVPPTALLCFSDHWAPLVYRALKKLHLKIPRDISVMGYCGTPNSAYMNPPLSTVAIDYREIGAKAIEILESSNQWFSPDTPEHSLPPFLPASYRVIERRSTKSIAGRSPAENGTRIPMKTKADERKKHVPKTTV